VDGGSGEDSMLWFQFEKGGDGTNHCQKMKQRQRAHLGSMGDVGVATSAEGEVALGREKEGDYSSWADLNLTRVKMKKIHVDNSVAINKR
jgi:hypothetical protein